MLGGGEWHGNTLKYVTRRFVGFRTGKALTRRHLAADIGIPGPRRETLSEIISAGG